jgi:hypothetical protein
MALGLVMVSLGQIECLEITSDLGALGWFSSPIAKRQPAPINALPWPFLSLAI